jgi:hypothetical protein
VGHIGSTPTPEGLLPIGSDELRDAVLVVLRGRLGHPRSVAQIVQDLAALGLRPDGGRPGKVVADTVWEEIRRGRVEQAGLARYRLARTGGASLSTPGG